MNHPPQTRLRLTAATTVGGTLAVTLALLAGMPYILWRATGLPWPEHVSSVGEFSQRLTQPISDPLMIDLLAMVGWLCWAAFAFTVVRETIWYATHLPQLLRDRHAHHEHVASLSVKGSLAALCIGTLVIALIGLWRPDTVSAQQQLPSSGESRAHTAATATFVTAPSRPSTSCAVSMRAMGATTTAGPGSERHGVSGTSEATRNIEHTVIEGDTLWTIAHTYLGDALTWPRIYALNKDRVQSDGARLTEPDLILPGWQLTIPVARAATPAPKPSTTETTPEPDAPPTKAAEPAPTQSAPGHHKDAAQQGSGTPAQSGQRHETTAQPTGTQARPVAISLGHASLIGITTAAGLLAARRYWHWHQHRRREPGRETEPPALSPLVDKAAQAAHAATRPLPPADPELLAPRSNPPQPPRAPGTVTIGVRHDAEIPLDELAIPGGCAWTGSGAQGTARALLVGVLTAAERQRPGPSRVTAVIPRNLGETLLPSLPDQFTALTQSPNLADAVRAAEQHLIAHARNHDEHDTTPAATLQPSADSAADTEPGTLLLLTVPDAAHTGQLQALAAHSSPGTLVVLTLGTALPGAASWHIADDGTVTTKSHRQQAKRLRLFHLTPEAGRDMVDVLLTANGQHPRPHHPPTPAPRPHSDSDPPDPAPAPQAEEAPVRRHTVEVPQPKQTKPVRLNVLGPVTLYARGHQDPIGTNLRGEVREFLALLAAHPTGLLAADIADKLHLAPGTDQSGLKNLRRAVRRALRAATEITAQEFILLQGELHKLHPELVETDLKDFNGALKEAFPASGSNEDEDAPLAAVRAALGHYRGPFAHGSDYLWADTIREHLAIKAIDATLRLAHNAEHAKAAPSERDAVLTLLEHLGTIHPDHERLAQHSIRLYQAAGRHDAARHVHTRLTRCLADLGLEPEAATQALITPRSHSRQTR
ncbi:transcriptional regulator [Streptomyces sp. WAC 06738]|uniref:BTAD domain-containing putative transcriptional regulator n=1 Tax=Streptomyces sp. WAC 06738 TaxID=2203210 RepID=UPI000F6BDF10|nr:BTAD domain-containing putative transcriptional regulator [Streptomyces sp. WAC 06738]AZM48776.1 transcriptional regulator [Streptomyces sp. WAC 06738]